ncbi:MAG: peptide chain release factor 1 [Acidimicrobiia bacterium]
MLDRLAQLNDEFDRLERELGDIYAAGDQRAAAAAGRRHSELRPIVEAYRELEQASADSREASEMLATESDAEMRGFLESEVAEKRTHVARLEEALKELLLPKDPNDGRNVIVEIRGSEGGEEANLWAGSLFRMYQRVAERHGWKVEVLESQESDLGGFREMVFTVKGDEAWAHLKYEAGTHRVQRVPETESQGRIHTSAATVIVLPEAEEVDVEIDPNSLTIDVYRSSGPGGQSVNTTDSAVRITHKPSGLVVTCQDQKSQLQNKEQAMRILRSRLLQAEQDKRAESESSTRKSQVGSGGRSEKIRTYNFKESRVTDHRVGVTKYALDQVLDGDLDEFTSALRTAERADQLSATDS